VVLVGPRQAGKTTLARAFVPSSSACYFDLENPLAAARLNEPMSALAPLTGLVVIDEIQRAPDIFPVLRVLADRVPNPARFLLLGSASPALLRQLLGIADQDALLAHPRCGASWEGFVLETMLRRLQPDEAYFWATHTGTELDALLIKDGIRLGLEIKRADAPRLTPSMRHAMTDLKLDTLRVLYPGRHRYSLADRVEVVPFATGMQ
jgi:predicted AAA+ superfamily ATPase